MTRLVLAVVWLAFAGSAWFPATTAWAQESKHSPGAAALPKLELSAAANGSLLPFTVAQPLREGQVPAGSLLVANLRNFQCVIKNRWPDGSAKIALLSGRLDFRAGTKRRISLDVAGTPSASEPIDLDLLRATGLAAKVAFGPYGTASWSGTDWNRPVQQLVSGPQMSSWTYRKPIGSDAHLVAWLEVRAYKGGHVEVLPWIENGYLNVPDPTEKAGMATFTLGGTQRFSQALTLLNHQRAVLAEGTTLTHWLGTDPQVVPRHDTAYMMATRLVPHYSAATPPDSKLYSRLSSSYTPLMQAGYPPAMGMAGYHPSIGLLPEWDVAYLSTAGDEWAWRSVIIGAYAAGRYGIHYRDEKTQRPLSLASYPNLVMRAGSGVSSSGESAVNTYTPTPAGAVPPVFATSHHPSMGYMAYLVSGWNYFVEESQFVATANYLKQTDTIRQGSKGILESSTGALTTRGAAWALRSLAQAAAITPDADPLRAQFVNSVGANIDYYHGRYIAKPANALGLVQPYSSYTGSDPWTSAIWMDDFFTAAFGYLKDLKAWDPALKDKLDAFTTWKYRSVIGRLGGSGSDEFAWPYAAQYTVNYAPSLKADWAGGTGPWYASWGKVARAMSVPASGGMGLAMAVGYPGSPGGYWSSLMPALSYAVEQGAAGADLAWARVASSPNFAVMLKGFNDQPVWSVTPR